MLLLDTRRGAVLEKMALCFGCFWVSCLRWGEALVVLESSYSFEKTPSSSSAVKL
jgi:hypothetical protein